MLRRLAALTVRRPKTVLLAVLVLLGVSVALSGSVSDKLGTGGNTDPASESSKADEYLDQHFGTTANLVIRLLPREGTVESPEVAAVKDRVLRVIAEESKAKVTRAFGDEGTSDLRSKDGRSGLVLVHVGERRTRPPKRPRRSSQTCRTTRTSRCVRAERSASSRRSATRSNTTSKRARASRCPSRWPCW